MLDTGSTLTLKLAKFPEAWGSSGRPNFWIEQKEPPGSAVFLAWIHFLPEGLGSVLPEGRADMRRPRVAAVNAARFIDIAPAATPRALPPTDIAQVELFLRLARVHWQGLTFVHSGTGTVPHRSIARRQFW